MKIIELRIIGIEEVRYDFVGKDGTPVKSEGLILHGSYPLMPDEGTGVERCYFSHVKLKMNNYSPKIGDDVVVGFNAWHKPAKIRLKNK